MLLSTDPLFVINSDVLDVARGGSVLLDASTLLSTAQASTHTHGLGQLQVEGGAITAQQQTQSRDHEMAVEAPPAGAAVANSYPAATAAPSATSMALPTGYPAPATAMYGYSPLAPAVADSGPGMIQAPKVFAPQYGGSSATAYLAGSSGQDGFLPGVYLAGSSYADGYLSGHPPVGRMGGAGGSTPSHALYGQEQPLQHFAQQQPHFAQQQQQLVRQYPHPQEYGQQQQQHPYPQQQQFAQQQQQFQQFQEHLAQQQQQQQHLAQQQQQQRVAQASMLPMMMLSNMVAQRQG